MEIDDLCKEILFSVNSFPFLSPKKNSLGELNTFKIIIHSSEMNNFWKCLEQEKKKKKILPIKSTLSPNIKLQLFMEYPL